jgi:uncharacterized membrane protein YjjP (DUF1212 family)
MEDTLRYIMDIGEQMLINGAEVYRVEDSVKRMCTAMGAKRTDVFIITSNMVTTVYTKDDASFTQSRRIFASGTDIERLHRLNALSRKICAQHLSLEEIRLEYEDILNCKQYPFCFQCVACAMIAGSFTLFFGGTYPEALISLIIGVLVKFVVRFTEYALMNKIFAKFICTFLASAIAYGAVRMGWIYSIDSIIIGNIMVLIPGIGLTNALRDLFTGDSIAGILRTVEAVLSALAIAAGYFLFTCTLGGL